MMFRLWVILASPDGRVKDKFQLEESQAESEDEQQETSDLNEQSDSGVKPEESAEEQAESETQ